MSEHIYREDPPTNSLASADKAGLRVDNQYQKIFFTLTTDLSDLGQTWSAAAPPLACSAVLVREPPSGSRSVLGVSAFSSAKTTFLPDSCTAGHDFRKVAAKTRGQVSSREGHDIVCRLNGVENFWETPRSRGRLQDRADPQTVTSVLSSAALARHIPLALQAVPSHLTLSVS